MAQSLTLNRRSALWATLFFLVFAYEALRTIAVVNGGLIWIPHVEIAPSWARIGFHAALGTPAAALCAFWAYHTLTSMRLNITPCLTVTSARDTVGPWFARRLPPAPNGPHTIQFNPLSDWRCWGIGTGLFLVTALPLWVLLVLVGHIAAVGPVYLVLQAGRQAPLWLTATVGVVGLVAIVIRRRHNRGDRPSGADRPALVIIGFIFGSDQWSARDRWRASVLYSLWLQLRGVFPLLTLLTAVLSQRLIIELYRRQVAAGQSPDEALSHVLTIRVARITAALLFYSAFAVIKLWPFIW